MDMIKIDRLVVLAGALSLAMSAFAFTPAQAAPHDELHSGHSWSQSSFGGGRSGPSGVSGFHENRHFRFSNGPQLPDHQATDPSCYLHHNMTNPAWDCQAM
jgi:hypothetical protein